MTGTKLFNLAELETRLLARVTSWLHLKCTTITLLNEVEFRFPGISGKNHWVLVQFFPPEAPLDGVGVALKVKVRQSNEDIASSRLGRRYSVCLSPCEEHLRHLTGLPVGKIGREPNDS